MAIVQDVAVEPNSNQRGVRTVGRRSKQVHRKIRSPNPIGIIQIKNRREILRQRCDQLGVIDREGEPIDIRSRIDVAGQRDRLAVGRQDVAKLLGGHKRVVVAAVDLCGLSDQRRVTWYPSEGQACRGKSNVRISDRGSRELLVFAQSDLQLIGTPRESLAYRIRIAQCRCADCLAGDLIARANPNVVERGLTALPR